MKIFSLLAAFSLALPSIVQADAAADKLVSEVMQAHGDKAFRAAKKISFTFVVLEPGKTTPLLEAKHVWDLTKQTATVEWKGKKASIDLCDPASYADGDAKAAHARWTNDTYWLIAPFKLRDAGTKVAAGGKRSVDGTEYETLEISYQGVGLTPGDRYTWFIDPKTKLLVRWEYRPDAEKVFTSPRKNADVSGLQLPTQSNFGDKTLLFKDIAVER